MTTETQADARTPGPWRFDGHGINGDSGRRLLKCSLARHDDDGKINPEFDEVSRLAAAAPDLLEALRELELRTSQFIDGTLVTFPAALLPQVRATIAHATGEVTP